MMRRTLESVAAERLNKLGKNPNIISSRVDLKSDRETLKDIVAKSSPANSSRCSSEGGGSPPLKQSKSFIFQTTNLVGNLRRNNSASELDAIDSENAKGTSPASSPKQSKLKTLKDNLHIHLPHILTKSSTKILANKTSSGASSPENTANNPWPVWLDRGLMFISKEYISISFFYILVTEMKLFFYEILTGVVSDRLCLFLKLTSAIAEDGDNIVWHTYFFNF